MTSAGDWLTTNARVPSGVITIWVGSPPVTIGVPAVMVARSTGTILPPSISPTQAVVPSGVRATFSAEGIPVAVASTSPLARSTSPSAPVPPNAT